MTNARFAVMVLLGLAFVGIGLSAFTINERELAIKLRLGEVVQADYDHHGSAGANFHGRAQGVAGRFLCEMAHYRCGQFLYLDRRI